MWSSNGDVLELTGVPEDEENLHWVDEDEDEGEDDKESDALDDEEWDPEEGVEEDEEEGLGWKVSRDDREDDWG